MENWISPTQASNMVEDRTPPGLTAEFRCGVVLTNLVGTVADVARAKLQPVEPDAYDRLAPGIWPITAAWAEMVLAPSVPDAFRIPEYAFATYDQDRLIKERSLAIVTTIRFPGAITRHDCVTSARRLAQGLARDWRATSLLVLHVPGDGGHKKIDIHAHVVTLARAHLPTGFAEPLTKLLGPRGPGLLHDVWADIGGCKA